MRTTLVILIALALITQPAPKPSTYPITAVPLADVQITEGFWKTRLETNRTVTIPHIMRQNELTGRIDNFLKAGHKITGEYKGQRYNDTDVYKIVEATSYSLVSHLQARSARRSDGHPRQRPHRHPLLRVEQPREGGNGGVDTLREVTRAAIGWQSGSCRTLRDQSAGRE